MTQHFLGQSASMLQYRAKKKKKGIVHLQLRRTGVTRSGVLFIYVFIVVFPSSALLQRPCISPREKLSIRRLMGRNCERQAGPSRQRRPGGSRDGRTIARAAEEGYGGGRGGGGGVISNSFRF